MATVETSPEDIQRYSDEFDRVCQQRHEMGTEKYGDGTYLEVDTLEMAVQEVVDLANYARYTYIKLRILQDALGTDRTTVLKTDEERSQSVVSLGRSAEPAVGTGFISFRRDKGPREKE